MTKLWLFKGFAQSTALHSNDHNSTDSTSDEERKSLVGLTSQTGWSCTKLHGTRVHAIGSKLRSRVTTTGRAKASWVLMQGWRRKLVIIYHTTDIVCSFHCQIIDCYDLNEWLTIVRYNRFSPNKHANFFVETVSKLSQEDVV